MPSGRPSKLTDELINSIQALRSRGYGFKRIAKSLSIPRTTVWRYVQQIDAQKRAEVPRLPASIQAQIDRSMSAVNNRVATLKATLADHAGPEPPKSPTESEYQRRRFFTRWAQEKREAWEEAHPRAAVERD